MTRMGWHYTPCDRGGGNGGGGVVVLLIVAVIIIAAIARPAAQAADAIGRVIVEVLEITGIVLASAAGLAVLAGTAYGASRLYRWHARNHQALPGRHAPAALRGSEALAAAQQAVLDARRPAAIEAPVPRWPYRPAYKLRPERARNDQ